MVEEMRREGPNALALPIVVDEHGFSPWVVRTHFDDDLAWAAVLAEVREPWGDDMRAADHPLLAATCARPQDCVDFPEEYQAEFEFGPWFRTVPKEVQAIHVNLALANMDFAEFSRTAREEPDHVFRGFSR